MRYYFEAVRSGIQVIAGLSDPEQARAKLYTGDLGRLGADRESRLKVGDLRTRFEREPQ